MESSPNAKVPSPENGGSAAKIRTKRSLPASKYSVAQVKGLVANMKSSLAGVKDCFPGGARALGSSCAQEEDGPCCERSGNDDDNDEDYYPPKGSSLLLAKDSLTLVKIKSRTEKCLSREGNRKFVKSPPRKLGRESANYSKARGSRDSMAAAAKRSDPFLLDPRVPPLEVYSCSPCCKESSSQRSRVNRCVSFAEPPVVSCDEYPASSVDSVDENSMVNEAYYDEVNWDDEGTSLRTGESNSFSKKSLSGVNDPAPGNRHVGRPGTDSRRSLGHKGIKGMVANALAGVKESVADVKGSVGIVKGTSKLIACECLVRNTEVPRTESKESMSRVEGSRLPAVTNATRALSRQDSPRVHTESIGDAQVPQANDRDSSSISSMADAKDAMVGIKKLTKVVLDFLNKAKGSRSRESRLEPFKVPLMSFAQRYASEVRDCVSSVRESMGFVKGSTKPRVRSSVREREEESEKSGDVLPKDETPEADANEQMNIDQDVSGEFPKVTNTSDTKECLSSTRCLSGVRCPYSKSVTRVSLADAKSVGSVVAETSPSDTVDSREIMTDERRSLKDCIASTNVSIGGRRCPCLAADSPHTGDALSRPRAKDWVSEYALGDVKNLVACAKDSVAGVKNLLANVRVSVGDVIECVQETAETPSTTSADLEIPRESVKVASEESRSYVESSEEVGEVPSRRNTKTVMSGDLNRTDSDNPRRSVLPKHSNPRDICPCRSISRSRYMDALFNKKFTRRSRTPSRSGSSIRVKKSDSRGSASKRPDTNVCHPLCKGRVIDSTSLVRAYVRDVPCPPSCRSRARKDSTASYKSSALHRIEPPSDSPRNSRERDTASLQGDTDRRPSDRSTSRAVEPFRTVTSSDINEVPVMNTTSLDETFLESDSMTYASSVRDRVKGPTTPLRMSAQRDTILPVSAVRTMSASGDEVLAQSDIMPYSSRSGFADSAGTYRSCFQRGDATSSDSNSLITNKSTSRATSYTERDNMKYPSGFRNRAISYPVKRSSILWDMDSSVSNAPMMSAVTRDVMPSIGRTRMDSVERHRSPMRRGVSLTESNIRMMSTSARAAPFIPPNIGPCPPNCRSATADPYKNFARRDSITTDSNMSREPMVKVSRQRGAHAVVSKGRRMNYSLDETTMQKGVTSYPPTSRSRITDSLASQGDSMRSGDSLMDSNIRMVNSTSRDTLDLGPCLSGCKGRIKMYKRVVRRDTIPTDLDTPAKNTDLLSKSSTQRDVGTYVSFVKRRKDSMTKKSKERAGISSPTGSTVRVKNSPSQDPLREQTDIRRCPPVCKSRVTVDSPKPLLGSSKYPMVYSLTEPKNAVVRDSTSSETKSRTNIPISELKEFSYGPYTYNFLCYRASVENVGPAPDGTAAERRRKRRSGKDALETPNSTKGLEVTSKKLQSCTEDLLRDSKKSILQDKNTSPPKTSPKTKDKAMSQDTDSIPVHNNRGIKCRNAKNFLGDVKIPESNDENMDKFLASYAKACQYISCFMPFNPHDALPQIPFPKSEFVKASKSDPKTLIKSSSSFTEGLTADARSKGLPPPSKSTKSKRSIPFRSRSSTLRFRSPSCEAGSKKTLLNSKQDLGVHGESLAMRRSSTATTNASLSSGTCSLSTPRLRSMSEGSSASESCDRSSASVYRMLSPVSEDSVGEVKGSVARSQGAV